MQEVLFDHDNNNLSGRLYKMPAYHNSEGLVKIAQWFNSVDYYI